MTLWLYGFMALWLYGFMALCVYEGALNNSSDIFRVNETMRKT